MLGVRADAKDVVQDAWLRWHQADRNSRHSEEAWLVTVADATQAEFLVWMTRRTA